MAGTTSTVNRVGGARRVATVRPARGGRSIGQRHHAVRSQTDVDVMMDELKSFLYDDLPHLFDDVGIDTGKYNDTIAFRDPITSYDSISGYLFNIAMLRNVFDPEFILHDVKRTGDLQLTTRWTMNMRLAIPNPLASAGVWDPRLTFTGTSIMDVDEQSGKFISHVDTWDSLDDSSYFSLPAVAELGAQVFSLGAAPKDLWTPPYTLHRRFANGLEVRAYDDFVAAETSYTLEPARGNDAAQDDGKVGGVNVSGNAGGGAQGVSAFRSLAGYIFGANAASDKMAMTVPVSSGANARVAGGDTKMQFFLPLDNASDAPSPNESSVNVVNVAGGVYAARAFRGEASADVVLAEMEQLLRLCEQNRLVTKGGSDAVELLAYNGPGTAKALRRYEVRVPLDGFELP